MSETEKPAVARTRAVPAATPARGALGALTAFRTTLRSILLTKRTPILFAVLLIPLGVSMILYPTIQEGDYRDFTGDRAPPGEGGRYWFEDSLQIILFGLLVPLVLAFFATGLIGDEVSQKTLPYLFTRPVRRWTLFLTKFAAFLVAMAVLIILAVTIHFFVTLSADQNPWRDVDRLVAIWGVVLLGIYAMGGLFALMGVLVRFPLAWAISYFVLWENVFGNFPGFIRRLTVVFYQRMLVTEVGGRTEFRQEVLGLAVSPTASVLWLLGIGTVCLVAACIVVSTKDYNV